MLFAGVKICCLQVKKYAVCRCVRAPFSPDILQAGAVKVHQTLFANTKE